MIFFPTHFKQICIILETPFYISLFYAVGILRYKTYFFIEKLGPGTNTKQKSKGKALGESISLNLVYTTSACIIPTILSNTFSKNWMIIAILHAPV